MGVVQLMTDRGVYSEEDLDLFDGLVAQMGAAVRNARLQQERLRLEAAEAAARAVALEREQAAHVLEAVGDGIFLVDQQGVVRLWNAAAALATGLSADQVLGRKLVDIAPATAALADRVEVATQGAMARPLTLPVELGGRDLWLSFVAVRVVYAFRDVTVETRLEEEKTDFVATISHELRTPMTAVYGAAQTLLRREDIPPEQRRQLIEMIATQAARLSQITEEVLLTTRLDRDQITVHHEPVDVGAAVQSAVQAMRSHLPEDMEMQVEIAADVGRAAGDSDRIQQVLLNLIDNAAKHGRSPVRISARTSNGLVSIAVSDSGPGIAPGERERIFEKFYRAGPQLTRLSGGTGLGLYISRELTRRMGGRLRVESEPGAGATFVVELSSQSEP